MKWLTLYSDKWPSVSAHYSYLNNRHADTTYRKVCNVLVHTWYITDQSRLSFASQSKQKENLLKMMNFTKLTRPRHNEVGTCTLSTNPMLLIAKRNFSQRRDYFPCTYFFLVKTPADQNRNNLGKDQVGQMHLFDHQNVRHKVANSTLSCQQRSEIIEN